MAYIPYVPYEDAKGLLAELYGQYGEGSHGVDHIIRVHSLNPRSMRDHVGLYFGEGALEFWLAPEIHSHYGDSVEELSRVVLLQHCHSSGLAKRRPGLPGLPRRPFLELLEAAAGGLDVRLSTMFYLPSIAQQRDHLAFTGKRVVAGKLGTAV